MTAAAVVANGFWVPVPMSSKLVEAAKERQVYRTEACVSILQGEMCPQRYGTCCYAHHISELEAKIKDWRYKKKECRFGEKNCYYGLRCEYLHAGDTVEFAPDPLTGAISCDYFLVKSAQQPFFVRLITNPDNPNDSGLFHLALARPPIPSERLFPPATTATTPSPPSTTSVPVPVINLSTVNGPAKASG